MKRFFLLFVIIGVGYLSMNMSAKCETEATAFLTEQDFIASRTIVLHGEDGGTLSVKLVADSNEYKVQYANNLFSIARSKKSGFDSMVTIGGIAYYFNMRLRPYE